MKKIVILFLTMTLGLFLGAKGDGYEPDILITETDAPVMLYLPKIDIGFTAVKVNAPQDYRIHSSDGEVKLSVVLDVLSRYFKETISGKISSNKIELRKLIPLGACRI